MLVSHRTTSSSAAVARGTSSRVRPFAAAVNRSSRAQQKQQRLVAKAAEEEQPEAETEEVPEQAIAAEEFEFSFSEAKKGNQWQPSDVTAALEYYEAEKFLGGSSDMPYEAEFVTNPLSVYEGGPEDSSWLADIDNNEAYVRDEYSLAGIPEAAPKSRGGRRRRTTTVMSCVRLRMRRLARQPLMTLRAWMTRRTQTQCGTGPWTRQQQQRMTAQHRQQVAAQLSLTFCQVSVRARCLPMTPSPCSRRR